MNKQKPTNEVQSNGVVSIRAVVPIRFAVQIKKLHNKHDVKLISEKGLNEDFSEVRVEGSMPNLKLLNEEAGIAAYGAVLMPD
jgi:hypothetical protein